MTERKKPMGTILNKVVPNRKAKIRIIKDGFTSPILGLTYIGQIKTLNLSTASRFVAGGYAEFVDETDLSPLAGQDGGGEASPAAPVEGGGEKEPETLTLEAAIKTLDPDDDAHWTKSGLPDLNVLKELTGDAVKRQDVEDVAPDFTRDTAREVKA